MGQGKPELVLFIELLRSDLDQAQIPNFTGIRLSYSEGRYIVQHDITVNDNWHHKIVCGQ